MILFHLESRWSSLKNVYLSDSDRFLWLLKYRRSQGSGGNPKNLAICDAPKRSSRSRADDLFRSKLDNIINPKHELAQLGGLIDWVGFEKAFGRFYRIAGRPALPTRLMVGLCYLKHSFDVSDERLLDLWVENLYWQHFCSFNYFQHKPPCGPTSLVRH